MDGLLPRAEDEAVASFPLLVSGVSSDCSSSVSSAMELAGGQGKEIPRSRRSKMQMYGKSVGGAYNGVTVESSALYKGSAKYNWSQLLVLKNTKRTPKMDFRAGKLSK